MIRFLIFLNLKNCELELNKRTVRTISELISKSFIKQILKFAIVGAIGTIVNISILYLLTEYLNVFYIISEVFAFIMA
ncbi:MAG: hypothetical protein EU547_07465, partial [Promethearchaeota archaeon]